MITTGIILIAIGFAVALGAFSYAALSMGKTVSTTFRAPDRGDRFGAPSPLDKFGQMFARFTGAMVVMVLGSFTGTVGIVLVLVGALQQVT